MTIRIDDVVLDTYLNYLKNNVDKIVLLTSDPGTNFTDANTNNGTSTGKKLAEQSVTSANFTIADDATTGGGRKITAAAFNDVNVLANGDATHFAWLDTANSKVLHVTELVANRTGLTAGSVVDFAAHSHTIRDAVAAA